MAGIVSKNLYDLLGNDPDQDEDREPDPPTQAIDKPTQRSGKRNAGGELPAGRGGARGRGSVRGGGGSDVTGNEQAFRDRGVGSFQNRSHAPDGEGRHPDRAPRGEGRGRGRGRGGRGRGDNRGDRHPNRNGPSNEHDKQTDHSWGANTGEAELADEKAGDAMAKEEEKDAGAAWAPDTSGGDTGAEGSTWAPDTSGGDAAGDATWKADGEGETSAPAEPEGPKQLSYEAYLAEQAKKKLDLGGTPEARKPNEGSSKKFKEGKQLKRSEEEDAFIAGTGPKTKRERQQKDKNTLDLEGQIYKAPDTEGGRGGRGRGRGRGSRGGDSFPPRGRGDSPRGRGDSPRSRGEGRGRGRGGERGDYRGGRGSRGQSGPNVDDQTAFPSLGA